MKNLSSQTSTKSIILLTALGLTLVSVNACSNSRPVVGETIQEVETPEGVRITKLEDRHIQQNGKIAGSESVLIQAEATVDSINYKTRAITLKSKNTEEVSLIAGPEIKNFMQIKKGDSVKVEYLSSIGFEVRKPTEIEIANQGSAHEVLARAQKGEKPAAGVAKGATIIATIETIEKSNNTVTIKDSFSKKLLTFKAKYPENLAFAKVGDSVVITIIEAVASSVEKVN